MKRVLDKKEIVEQGEDDIFTDDSRNVPLYKFLTVAKYERRIIRNWTRKTSASRTWFSVHRWSRFRLWLDL